MRYESQSDVRRPGTRAPGPVARPAAVGSANLTSGLVANVEAVAVLTARRDAPPLARLWERAESWWGHADAVDWAPGRIAVAAEVLQPDLLAAIRAIVAVDAEVRTLASGNPNLAGDVTPDGVWVETQRSRRLGRRRSSSTPG